MIGTATAFVDKLVAQQRQATEKAAARPDLDYAHPENWSKDEVAIWLASKGTTTTTRVTHMPSHSDTCYRFERKLCEGVRSE